MFIEIVNVIKAKNKFMRVLRIGLRKINNCILLDANKLNEFFDEKCFNNIVKEFDTDKSKINLMNSEKIDSFNFDDKNVNLIRHLTQGILKTDNGDKSAYQVVLDIDVYIKDENIFNCILVDKKELNDELIKINTTLFKIYVRMLKDKFINQLKNNGVDERIILGVEKND